MFYANEVRTCIGINFWWLIWVQEAFTFWQFQVIILYYANPALQIFVYLNVRHSGTLFLMYCMYHYFFKNISHVRPIWNFDRICICVFVYMYVCVFVYLYLHVRQLGTLFLMSSYHFLSENIAYVGHICNFDQSSICVFVFLYICICMSDRWKLCFQGFKYIF